MARGVQVLLLLALTGFCCGTKVTDDPPKFASPYMVSGVLRLPYAEINEPFTAYYDADNKRSRIDYYGQMVVTIQRGDVSPSGVSYKLAPMSNYKVKNMEMCFQMNGTVNATVGTQTIFPDLTGFKNIGTEVMSGHQTTKWQMVSVVGTKKSTYTMWVEKTTNDPIRYEMMGYDSLLGSHYDKYILDYFNYTSTNISKDKFSPPPNMTCGDFPGPGYSHHITMNPMQEFIHSDDSHIEPMFNSFKDKHKREYSSAKEHVQRQHVFRQNVRYIYSRNRAGLTYTMAVNHLADHTSKELKLMNGYRYSPGSHGGLPFHKEKYDLTDLPDQLDWRLYGAVTPVKDQAVCGSCWSFGTTGTIEGAYFLKTKNLVRLSQQQLMDCSWGEGNNACDGGEDFRSYDFIMKSGGITTEEQYGPYLGADGHCHSVDVTPVVKLSGYVNVTAYDLQALKIAIANEGPISVSIDASHKSLSFYANGVYYEPACGSDPDSLDHSVLAVGYGVMNGQAYWLIKNSWSTYWGDAGFVLMSQKNNNCGVATAPTYVQIAN